MPSTLRSLRSHDDKILRGMWGKRSSEREEKKYYVLIGGRGHHLFKPLGGFRQMDLLSKKMDPKKLMQFNGKRKFGLNNVALHDYLYNV